MARTAAAFSMCLTACLSYGMHASAQDGIPEKTLDVMKAATVYIKAEGTQGKWSGSGFLVNIDGQTGLIATNRHVAVGGRGKTGAKKYTIVFWSGTKKELILSGELAALDNDEDLAVLKVTSKGLPAPINLAPASLRETLTVYTFGFPLGDALATDRANPSVTIGKATISSLPEDSNGKLDRVQLDGEVNPGNSGGPVVDVQGRLVGVVVAKIAGTRINFAIPHSELTAMLAGRASSAQVKSARVDKGSAEVELEIPLADPMGKIAKVEVRFVRKETTKTMPTCDRAGIWTQLASAESIPVKIENGKAIAKVTVRGQERETADFYFQTAYAHQDGKLLGTKPTTHSINFSRPGIARGNSPQKWETIVSKAGGFTVDMPSKPVINETSTENIGRNTVKTLILGCVTKNGVYLAYRMDLPGAVPPRAEEQVLDALRDFFAEQWHGKVVTEKRVRTAGGLGRDFMINGKPEGDEVASIRVRQYLIGRSLFAVVVMAPGTEMPEDAGRFLGSLALGEAKTRASATPEPERTGPELKGWGMSIDPDSDCKITPTEKTLTFDIPGKLHDLYFDGGPTNAPRVMREVEGDFVATVKVCGEFKPGPRSTNPKSVPFHGAGILLWSDSQNNLRFERTGMLRGKQYNSTMLFEEREGGYAGANYTELFPGGDCYLRIERKANKIIAASSMDGKKWKTIPPVDTVWPSKLKVGLTAITTSNSPFTVRFEEFEVKQKP